MISVSYCYPSSEGHRCDELRKKKPKASEEESATSAGHPWGTGRRGMETRPMRDRREAENQRWGEESVCDHRSGRRSAVDVEVVVTVTEGNPSKRRRREKWVRSVDETRLRTLIRCEGDDGRKFDPEVDRERDAGGDERRARSSRKGVLCSRLMVGALIDGDADGGGKVGRGTFIADDGRKRGY